MVNNRHQLPATGRMATVTVGRCQDMSLRFPARDYVIVARATFTDYFIVINFRRGFPSLVGMASVTGRR